MRLAPQECTGQKTQRSRASPSTLCHGVVRIVLTAPLSYAAVVILRGSCEELLRDRKLATSSLEELFVNLWRPNRVEPRVQKRRPKKYLFMTKPRYVLRKQLTQQALEPN